MEAVGPRCVTLIYSLAGQTPARPKPARPVGWPRPGIASMEQIRQIPLLDLTAQHRAIRAEVLEAVRGVIDSQKFILGAEVQALEREVAAYSQAAFAVGCASGSDALLLALLAGGVGPGDEVLTTPYTFFATVGAICRAGATPVFVDADPETFNLDAARAAAEIARRENLKAVIPVHLFGACADMDPILEAARKRGILVIEDAAQSIGAGYKGRRAGRLGDLGCFSFYPSKNLGGCGDGGMLTTGSRALAEKLVALREHGATAKYRHQYVGINSRLDALQAAVLRVKLRHLDDWTAARQANAARYRELMTEMKLPVRLPASAPHTTRHVYNQFVILAAQRDALQSHLKQRGVGTEIYYPVPMHLQECFRGLGFSPGQFPVSERLSAESLALPVYPELSLEDQVYVCRAIRSFYQGS